MIVIHWMDKNDLNEIELDGKKKKINEKINKLIN